MAGVTFTFLGGPTLTFERAPEGADPRTGSGITTIDGLESSNQISFTTRRFVRKRLAELEPNIALNVLQTPNRAGLVQLTSEKPCRFCRAEWNTTDGARYDFEGSEEAIIGLLVVSSAQLDGLTESLTLTLFRGDWYLRPDGAIERFV